MRHGASLCLACISWRNALRSVYALIFKWQAHICTRWCHVAPFSARASGFPSSDSRSWGNVRWRSSSCGSHAGDRRESISSLEAPAVLSDWNGPRGGEVTAVWVGLGAALTFRRAAEGAPLPPVVHGVHRRHGVGQGLRKLVARLSGHLRHQKETVLRCRGWVTPAPKYKVVCREHEMERLRVEGWRLQGTGSFCPTGQHRADEQQSREADNYKKYLAGLRASA